jgi:hypothetical protein
MDSPRGGVVRDQRHAPADRCGSDPQIGVVYALVQRVSNESALVAELRDALDCLGVHWQDRHVGRHRRELGDPTRSPAGLQRSVASLRHRLRRNRYQQSHEMLRVPRGQAGIATQARSEDVGVDDD